MVEVFKSNVQKETDTNYIIAVIRRQFPSYKVNFDLEDCDRILRVHAPSISNQRIIELLDSYGYHCEVLL